MIVLAYRERKGNGGSKALNAGEQAEKQMAHYLTLNFATTGNVYVLHGLRLEDTAQLEQDGSVGVCQICHLIVHRWGMFIVECKSVSEEVCIRSDGSGGGEWSRLVRGREKGMASPMRQAERQGEFLRLVLDARKRELLGRHEFGLRTLAKLQTGTDQRGFRTMPIQLVIAVSDKGLIRRLSGWSGAGRLRRGFSLASIAVASREMCSIR